VKVTFCPVVVEVVVVVNHNLLLVDRTWFCLPRCLKTVAISARWPVDIHRPPFVSPSHLHLFLTSSPPPPTTSVRGLCGVPDVPHEASNNNNNGTALTNIGNQRHSSSSTQQYNTTLDTQHQGLDGSSIRKSASALLTSGPKAAKRSKSSSIGDDDDDLEDDEDTLDGIDDQKRKTGRGMIRRESSTVREEGFGVITVTPSIDTLLTASENEPTQLTFSYAWTMGGGCNVDSMMAGEHGLSRSVVQEVKWSALLYKGNLYLNVPNGLVIERSKEAFVTLLEFAEEELDCSAIIVCFSKSRPERQSLMRMFMFLGFVTLPPKHALMPSDASEDTMYMAYELA